MVFFNQKDTIFEMNKLGREKRPFLFVVEFEGNKNLVQPLDEIDSDFLKYEFNDSFCKYQNFDRLNQELENILLKSKPIAFETYEKAFDIVKFNINIGNSFLTNLTVETPIIVSENFDKLIHFTKAKYKIWIKDLFVCFSPESFVSVDKTGKISSFPMKGTIDSNLINAKAILLNDPKEKFEHTTIVDLIRNDLSKICHKVWVERFRYVDVIQKQNGDGLLQISSEVCGQLHSNWSSTIGDWLFELLPAGSICGAPKDKTLNIIETAEAYTHKNGKRGFYSGVFGIFDGEILTSSVLIRFIEQTKDGLVYKSGGGLTSRSKSKLEYEELIQKIYVPIF